MADVDKFRIARNTVFLYVRTVLALLISLYTSRILLRLLGDADFGLFSLVGGFATLFAFLRSGTGAATVRYLSYRHGLEEGDAGEVFASSLRLHLYVAAVVLVLGETVGLWFVNALPDLPSDSIVGANVAWQSVLIAAVGSIIEMPYIAAVLAREHMGAYAALALLQAVVRLGAALALGLFGGADNLVIYSALYCAVSVAASAAWVVYGCVCLPECKSRAHAERRTVVALLSFASYDSIYGACTLTRRQGVLVIINALGGVVLNASAALALQVSSAATQLGEAIVLAFRPQIVSQYAAQAYDAALHLLFDCSRWVFVLLGAMCIPLMLETDFILALWLGAYPPYTVPFCRLCLMGALLEVMIFSLTAAVHATGLIGRVSISGGLLLLAELPLIIVAYFVSGRIEAVFAVHLFMLPFIMAVNLWRLSRSFPDFNLRQWLHRCVVSPFDVLMAALLAASPLMLLPSGAVRLCLVGAVTIIITVLTCYIFLLSRNQRRGIICRIFPEASRRSDIL